MGDRCFESSYVLTAEEALKVGNAALAATERNRASNCSGSMVEGNSVWNDGAFYATNPEAAASRAVLDAKIAEESKTEFGDRCFESSYVLTAEEATRIGEENATAKSAEEVVIDDELTDKQKAKIEARKAKMQETLEKRRLKGK